MNKTCRTLGVCSATLLAFLMAAVANAQVTKGGAKSIDIPLEFDAVQLTAENYAEFAARCFNTTIESVQSSSSAVANSLPVPFGSVSVVASSQASAYISIQRNFGACIKLSETGFPILATEVFEGSSVPKGAPEAILTSWYQAIARTLALRGTATVAYIFTGAGVGKGGAHIVTYSTSNERNKKGALFYTTEHKKAGQFDPKSGFDHVFSSKDNTEFVTTRPLSSSMSENQSPEASKGFLSHRRLK